MTGVLTALCIALLWAFYCAGLAVLLLFWLKWERKEFYRLLSDLPQKGREEGKKPIGNRLKELKEKWRARPASGKGGEGS